MSDDPTDPMRGAPAWASHVVGLLTDFGGRLGRVERVLERVETVVDRAADELRALQPRVTLVEEALHRAGLATAGVHGRMDRMEARLLLVEKRLELRDGGDGGAAG